MVEVLLLTSGPANGQCLRTGLQGEGMAVRELAFGERALALLDRHAPDALLLLHAEGAPAQVQRHVHALSAIRQVRARSDVPIVVLADLLSEDDRLLAFTSGADEFLARSVSCRELAARIRVHIRRKLGHVTRIAAPLVAGPLSLDASRHQATLRGQALSLTPIEFRLLALLAANPEVVLPHAHLLSAVWGPRHENDTQYLRVYVRSLRRKVEADPTHPKHLLTESGVGYVWRP